MLYGQEYRSANETVIWRIDVATGQRTQLLPNAGTQKRTVNYGDVRLTRDGTRLVYTSDEDGEFTQLMVMDLRTGQRTVLSKNLPWDIDALALRSDEPGADDSAAGRQLAAAGVNVAGRRELHVYDLVSGREIAVPKLPAAARSGGISRLRFAPDSDELGITVNSAQSPGRTPTSSSTRRSSSCSATC
jgi:Tol biopolymer transport system component